MIKICTSIEQSKKLLSLGLDPSTADMHYEDCMETFKLHASPSEYGYEYNIPAWSLTAILELMPRIITNEGFLCITPSHKDNGWVVRYDEENTSFPTLIDAAFEMVCKLIKLGHIKINK